MLGVELPVGHGQHALDDLPVLLLAGRHGEPAQAPGSVEVRHPRPLDEDLLDVAPGDQLGQGTEVGDRAQHPLDHLGRLDERELLAEQRDALVGVDRATDLGPDLVEVGLRAEPPALDPGVDVAPDDVVGVGAHAFLPHRVAADRDVTSCASDATAARNGPRPTSAPSHAAASTRASVGSQVIDSRAERPHDLGPDLLTAVARPGCAVDRQVDRRGGHAAAHECGPLERAHDPHGARTRHTDDGRRGAEQHRRDRGRLVGVDHARVALAHGVDDAEHVVGA